MLLPIFFITLFQQCAAYINFNIFHQHHTQKSNNFSLYAGILSPIYCAIAPHVDAPDTQNLLRLKIR